MIELILSGGLGNQMFEYSCARAMQIQIKDSLVINIWLMEKDRFKRNYSLDHLNIPKEIQVISKPRPFIRIMGGLSNHWGDLVYNLGSLFGVYIWRSNKFRRIELKHTNNLLYGYFQSERYFTSYSQNIRNELMPQIDGQKHLVNRIEETESVCVHIRRGDYVSENMIVCDLDYYTKAMNYFKEKLNKPVFYIFSDDIPWVKEHYCFSNVEYVDNENRDYEELFLMCRCKHFVISNSSFSWWAQFLSNNERKVVIAPDKWLPNDVVKDIYQDDWIIL